MIFESVHDHDDSKLVVDLSVVNRSQTNIFRNRVKQYGGLIRIFIHPYYEEYTHSRCWRDRGLSNSPFPRVELPSVGLSKILSKPAERTPAVVVFEEDGNLDITRQRLVALNGSSKNRVYLVPTFYDTSHPFFKRLPYARRKEGWDELTNILKSCGVSKIIIGGQRFIVEPGSDHKNNNGIGYVAWRCVGHAVDSLAPAFQVEVSNLTHPHARLDVEKIGPEYKGADDRFFALL